MVNPPEFNDYLHDTILLAASALIIHTVLYYTHEPGSQTDEFLHSALVATTKLCYSVASYLQDVGAWRSHSPFWPPIHHPPWYILFMQRVALILAYLFGHIGDFVGASPITLRTFD